MMMEASIAGGMDAFYDNATELRLEKFTDEHYKPNERYYELSGQEIHKLDFPRQHDGKLIKVLFGGLRNFVAHDPGYLIVFMHRPFEEVRQSYEAAINRKLPYTQEILETRLEETRLICMQRRDMKLIDVEYHDVLESPLHVFQWLAGQGWLADPVKAARVVDKRKRRFFGPELAIGA